MGGGGEGVTLWVGGLRQRVATALKIQVAEVAAGRAAAWGGARVGGGRG